MSASDHRRPEPDEQLVYRRLAAALDAGAPLSPQERRQLASLLRELAGARRSVGRPAVYDELLLDEVELLIEAGMSERKARLQVARARCGELYADSVAHRLRRKLVKRKRARETKSNELCPQTQASDIGYTVNQRVGEST